jgi:hypothetical protein
MPTQNEIGATARPDAPVQIVFVRLPADAPPQPGEPRPAAKPKRAPVRGKARRSPAGGRKRKQETKKMIKTFLAIFAAVAIYVAMGIMLPITGHTAVVFPALQVIPAVGLWICFLTYKGIAALAARSAIAKV